MRYVKRTPVCLGILSRHEVCLSVFLIFRKRDTYYVRSLLSEYSYSCLIITSLPQLYICISVGPMAVYTKHYIRNPARFWPLNKCQSTQTCRILSRRSPLCSSVTALTSSNIMEATSKTQTCG
jgi:hypothetical protein